MAVSHNIYRYKAELTFVNGSTAKVIDPKQIKSIVIDYDYDNYNMPLIYLNMAISKNILDEMVKNSNTGLINFTLYKYITNSDIANIPTVRIKNQFVYFLSEDINFNKQLDAANETRTTDDDLYIQTTIGLMMLNHLKWNKKQINGVLNGTTMVNAVYYCAGHIPLLIEPFTYNTTMNQILLPSMNSVSKAISYLNNLSVFYSTSYRFFMDFDTAYLVSSSGKPVIKKGEAKACNSVVFEILNTTAKDSTDQGMYIDTDQKIYRLKIAGTDIYRDVNKYTEKSYNNITAMTSNGRAGSVGVNINNSSYMNNKTRMIQIQNGNIHKLDNIKADIQNSAITMHINKNDVDTSIFTLNREYMINCKDVYPGNEGKYLLVSKKELYIREQEDYLSNVLLIFKKLS